MQKLCFAVESCICISNRHPCVKISSNEVNCRDGVSLVSGYLAAQVRSK